MQKKSNLQGLTIYYDERGQGEQTILILHGWGSNISRWTTVMDQLAEKGYRCLALDLPGFGQSDEPETVWDSETYTAFILKWMEAMAIGKVLLLGHSFGGKIATFIAYHQPEKVEALILVSSVGVPKKKALTKKLLEAAAPLTQATLSVPPLQRFQPLVQKIAYRIIGSHDYHKASPMMKKIMIKVLPEDLTPIFAKIQVPTILLWGDHDTATPLQEGQVIQQLIPHSQLKVLNGSHTFPYDQAEIFVETLVKTLKQV